MPLYTMPSPEEAFIVVARSTSARHVPLHSAMSIRHKDSFRRVVVILDTGSPQSIIRRDAVPSGTTFSPYKGPRLRWGGKRDIPTVEQVDIDLRVGKPGENVVVMRISAAVIENDQLHQSIPLLLGNDVIWQHGSYLSDTNWRVGLAEAPVAFNAAI